MQVCTCMRSTPPSLVSQHAAFAEVGAFELGSFCHVVCACGERLSLGYSVALLPWIAVGR